MVNVSGNNPDIEYENIHGRIGEDTVEDTFNTLDVGIPAFSGTRILGLPIGTQQEENNSSGPGSAPHLFDNIGCSLPLGNC